MTEPQRPLKTIKSFTLRGGKLTSGQQRALDELWPLYGLPLQNRGDEPLDLERVFGRRVPTILEIGFGDGEALIEVAQNNPHQNFVGVEVHRPGIGHLLLRLNQCGLTNVKVICEDAVEVLSRGIVNDSLAKICLFFPDPWPKKKHHKRRIVQSHFINLLEKKLQPGGVFHFATDWQEYAYDVMAKLELSTTLVNIFGEGEFCPRPQERPRTKFENRGNRLGHGVWDIIMEKWHSYQTG